MYHLWRSFLCWGFFFHERATLLFSILCQIFKVNMQVLVENYCLTADDEACFLTVATFKTIYEGFFKRRSVTNTAKFFHSSSDWGKQKKTQREKARGGEEERESKCQRGRKEREQSTALIYVYWFTSLPPHWFQCLLHPFRFHFIWRADTQPGPNMRPTSPFAWC